MAVDQVVDDDDTDCPNATATTIQQGVNQASAGDTVTVCAGEYAEQVEIATSAKDGLRLRSQEPLEATITYPATVTSPETLVHIDEADDVTVRGFEITGPYVGSGGFHSGVFVDNSLRAIIRGNAITQIREMQDSGAQDGFGVVVGRNFLESFSTALVAGNLISDYQKGGVLVDGASATTEDNSRSLVAANFIQADETLQDNLAPNGVQVSRGADGGVVRNAISENQFSGNPDAGTGSGIILFQPGQVLARENLVAQNDNNIFLLDTDEARIDGNVVRDAIVFDGIFADEDSRDNVIADNSIRDSAEHDCHDDSVGGGSGGSANTWTGNDGETQNRSGLCLGAAVTEPIFVPPTSTSEAPEASRIR